MIHLILPSVKANQLFLLEKSSLNNNSIFILALLKAVKDRWCCLNISVRSETLGR